RDAVEILIGESRHRVPSAAPQLVETLPGVEAYFLGGPARRRDEPVGHEGLAAVDQHDVAECLVVVHSGCTIAVLRIDAVDVGTRGLGDVRVGGDANVHAASTSGPPTPARRG